MTSLNSKQIKTYQWRNALKMINRHRQQRFLTFLGSFAYFLCLSLGLFLRKVLNEYIKIEEVPLYDDERVDSTLHQLINLLSQIEVGIILMVGGLILFGFFFFITGLRRQLLLNQEEIAIKRLLGSSFTQVTREFYLEYVLPIIVACVIGLLAGTLILGVIYLVVTLGYQQNWPTAWSHPLMINGMVMLVVSLIVTIQYRKTRRLIVKSENKKSN